MCQLACKGDIIKEGGGLAEGGGCKCNMITAVWSMDDDDNKSENTDDDIDDDKDADGRGGFYKCDRRCYFCIIITVWSIVSRYAVGMSCYLLLCPFLHRGHLEKGDKGRQV